MDRAGQGVSAARNRKDLDKVVTILRDLMIMASLPGLFFPVCSWDLFLEPFALGAISCSWSHLKHDAVQLILSMIYNWFCRRFTAGFADD